MYFIVRFFFLRETCLKGYVRLHSEAVLLASSRGLPGNRAVWPMKSLASSRQSAGHCPQERPQSGLSPCPVAWLRLAWQAGVWFTFA